MAEGEEAMSQEDWKEKCLVLEALLLKFRVQIIKIRELTADKIQQLEVQVMDAEKRAFTAQQQVQWMGEKLKDPSGQSGDSEVRWFQQCQELQALVQEKDQVIAHLEQQLDEQKQNRLQDAKAVEEKAVKIKEWVTLKLSELEVENTMLRETTKQQEAQLMDLHKQVRALEQQVGAGRSPQRAGEAHRLSSLTFGCFQVRGRNPQVLTGPTPSQRTLSTQEQGEDPVPLDAEVIAPNRRGAAEGPGPCRSSESGRPGSECYLTASDDSSSVFDDDMQRAERPGFGLLESLEDVLAGFEEQEGGKEESHAEVQDCTSEELNKQFQSQSLDCSSSSNHPNAPNPSLAVTLSPKRPIRPHDPKDDPAAPKQPCLRTPATAFGLMTDVSLVKKHLSQPPACSEASHTRTRNALSLLRPLRPQETPADPRQDVGMETGQVISPPPSPSVPCSQSSDISAQGSECDGPRPGNKPPTPPLHRLPSWESRIYAVAKSGIRLSDTSCTESANRDGSLQSSFPAFVMYTSLVYSNMATPLYATLRGKASLLSSSACSEVSSCSEDSSSSGDEDDSVGSPLSSCGSRKDGCRGSPRSLKRAVSMASMASDSDYAIPPDAYATDTECSECSEPELKLPRTCSSSGDSANSEPMEKSGYLLKMVQTWKKTWKRRWFVLKDGELLYYKSPSDVIRKPQGQVEVSASSSITRGDGKQVLQVVTGRRVCLLKADSPNLLEEWLRVLQSVLRVKAASPLFTQPEVRPGMKGTIVKVRHGHSKRVWCALIGKTLFYFRSQEDKFPLGQIQLREARVEEVHSSGDLDVELKSCGHGLEVGHFTVAIHPQDRVPTYLLIESCHEKGSWLYHLSVAAGNYEANVGTEFEQLVGKLFLEDGDHNSPTWRSAALCFTKEALCSPLTTLPSQALQTEAVKLFKTCQLFINVAIDAPAVDYHVSLAQSALQVCLSHPELQSELFCQLIKQTHSRRAQHGLLQGWQFLALCVGLFLPQHPFLWLLQVHLTRHADARTEVGKYAVYCQRSVQRTQQQGERRARPSRMEILSILLRNPYHHSLPFSVPVHFLNGTYQVVSFDASTTVDEFQCRLNQDSGMRTTDVSGFSLYSDDPTGRNLEHCLQSSLKICDIIAKWEQASKEQHTGKSENSRTVRLTYKNRMYFSLQVRGESERERLLLAYQTSEAIVAGHFPVNKELALEMAALLAQVEFGDYERAFSPPGSSMKSTQTVKQVFEKFYPRHYRGASSEEQLRQLVQRLAARWASLRGRSSSECVRIYLTVARKWPFFGAKLFEAESVSASPEAGVRVWLAVYEDGLSVLEHNSIKLLVSHPYKTVVRFGGSKHDFVLVVGQSANTSKDKATEKHVFAMDASKIREISLLISAYINSTQPHRAAAHRVSAP